MQLEDLSTKDLERLYYKHFGKKAFREEGDFKTDNEFKVEDDTIKAGKAEIGQEVESDIDYYASIPKGGKGRIVGQWDGSVEEGAYAVADPNNRYPGGLYFEYSAVRHPRPQKSLYEMSTKDLRNLYLKSLRIKHKKATDMPSSDEYKRRANLPTDALGRNRSEDPNEHKQGKIAQDYLETPRRGIERDEEGKVTYEGDQVRADWYSPKGDVPARVTSGNDYLNLELTPPVLQEGSGYTHRNVGRTVREIKHPIENVRVTGENPEE